jgi:hypothetical protein
LPSGFRDKRYTLAIFMQIGSENELIELLEIERAPEGAPNAGDVRVSVRVKLQEFCGLYDAVWLEEPALRRFLSEFAEVESKRRGSVSLESASPDEFRLTIRSRDGHGHFVAEVLLSRYQYSGPIYWRTTVSGGFEVDPTSLPSILKQFKSLHESRG